MQNRPWARFDPYAAYWARISASRAGAMAWHPPIFLSLDPFSPQETPSSARGGPPPAFSNPLTQFLPGWTSTPTDWRVEGNYPHVNDFDFDQQITPDIEFVSSNQDHEVGLTSARGGLTPPSLVRSTSPEPSPIRTAQAEIPSSPGMIAPALRAAVTAGHLTEEEAAILQQRANALGGAKDERLLAAVRAGLPKYDRETTYGVLITNEGNVVPLQSGGGNPLYGNYSSAGHVEGKAAIWIRENGSSGGVLYHNNPGGTCGRCNGQIRRLLPEGASLRVISPENAVPKNRRARVNPPPYVGDSAEPKPPQPAPPSPQLNLFDGRQP